MKRMTRIRITLQCIAAIALGFLAGCGGGGTSGDSTPVTPALTILDSSVPGTGLVSVDDFLWVKFNAPINPGSVASASVSLSADNATVPIEVTVQNNHINVTPLTRLKANTRYEITFKAGIKGSTGATLNADQRVGFGTPRTVFDNRLVVPRTDLMGGGFPKDLIDTGDFNDDGRLDIVVVGRNQADMYDGGYTVKIYHQAADGSFVFAQRMDRSISPSPSTTYIYRVVVLDIDHDGSPEIVIPEYQGRFADDPELVEDYPIGGLYIYDRSAEGSFEPASYLRTAYSQTLRVGDMNGDGHPDLVGSWWGNPGTGIQVFLSAPGGLQSLPPQMLTVERNVAVDAALADFNRDGHVDLLVHPFLIPPRLYTGDGTGQLELDGPATQGLANVCAAGCGDMVVIDLDKDGWLDLLIDGGYFRAADGSYVRRPGSSPAEESVGGSFYAQPADFDQDGHDDLVGLELWDQALYVTTSHGNGTAKLDRSFSYLLPQWWAIPHPAGAKVVDITGDGWMDLVMVDGSFGVMVAIQYRD